MKKLIAIISAAVVAAAGLLTFSACGSAEVTYALSEDGNSYIVSGVSGNKRALTEYEIPSTYDDGVNGVLPVTAVGEEAFMGTTLRSVTIPDSVTTIEDRAFTYTYLRSIEMPQSVTHIGYGAFAESALVELVVPQSVAEIERYAFAYCSSLHTAVINANIQVLDEGVLKGSVAYDTSGTYSDTVLTEIWLPAALKYIHEDAFSGNFLTDIYFSGTEDEWRDVKIFRKANEGEESDDGFVYFDGEDEETINYYSVGGLTIHCADADLVYSNGEIQSTPVN